jgi:phosphoglycolate phosphatase
LVYSKLKPHARDVLGTLKRRKKIIAIASNRPKYFTDLILKKLGIKKYFNIVLCADEINSKKPTPKILNTIAKRFSVDKNDAVYIGDMNIDLETAQRAHIDALFITGGSSTLREVRKYRNKKVLFDLKEILKLYC